MRRCTRLSSLFVLVSLAFSAGCSGGGSPQVPSSAMQEVKLGAVHAACPTNVLFALEDFTGHIDVYPATGTTRCKQITGPGLTQAMGIATDNSGDLYVANAGFSNILEFKPPYNTLSRTLNDPGQDPIGLAICKGYIAVTNEFTTSRGPGSVSIYDGTATSPSYTLTDPNAKYEWAPACDTSGNLFTTYTDTSFHKRMNEWLLAKGPVKELAQTSDTFQGGLEYEGSSLWVLDPNSSIITEYPQPYTKAGKTIRLLTPTGKPIFAFEMNSNDTGILGADDANGDLYFFSLTGKILRTVSTGRQLIGVAYSMVDN